MSKKPQNVFPLIKGTYLAIWDIYNPRNVCVKVKYYFIGVYCTSELPNVEILLHFVLASNVCVKSISTHSAPPPFFYLK